MLRPLLLLCLASLALPSTLTRVKRQSRANFQGCTTLPAGIDDPASPASDKASVEITCRTDSDFQFCQFQHSKPMDVNNKDLEIDCSANTGGNSNQQCVDDPRISIMPTSNSCNMKITSSEPDDTGRWTVVIVDLDGNQVTNDAEEITIYTYNQSVPTLWDITSSNNEQDIAKGTLDLSYNWDERRKRWKDGTSGNERYKLRCLAQFGSPVPTMQWIINGNEREDVARSSVFRVSESEENSAGDPGRLIKDSVSELDFTVDENMLVYLRDQHNIDINPTNGIITFDLECNIQQGNNGDYNDDSVTTRVNINRVYNSGKMRAATVGMIVGIVLAVLVVIFIVLITGFAKATERWCFADDEYQYRDPQDKRRPQGPHGNQR